MFVKAVLSTKWSGSASFFVIHSSPRLKFPKKMKLVTQALKQGAWLQAKAKLELWESVIIT
jgi:hypothetical protein